jgi:anti-sigma regulatory factor (Ser/Thr protein kinase)
METRRALVIDPENDVKDALAQILRARDWTVETAHGNAAALESVQATRFDLVVTSDRTSGHEDVELLRKIRRVHPHTRVIILTYEGTPTDVLNAMQEGAFSYFSRPFSFLALKQMVVDAVDGPCWDDGIEVLVAKPDWIQIAARSDTTTADRLLRFVQEMIDAPEPEKTSIAIALRELLMNAIEYGGHFDPEKYVELSYLRTRRSVTCRIKDPGLGFSLEEIKHAAIGNPAHDPLQHVFVREAEHLRPGGFGVLLARNSVDELIYNDKGNEVLMIKYVDRPPAAALETAFSQES